MPSFIFGGNTGLTYKDLQRLRNQSLARMGNEAPSIGSGIKDIGSAIASVIYNNKAKELEAEEKAKTEKFQGEYNQYLSDYMKPQQQTPQPQTEPQPSYASEQPSFEQSQKMAQEKITSEPLNDVGQQGGNYPVGFDNSFKNLMQVEGGYVEKDGKSGHPANFGINQGANPDIDVKNLTEDKAKELYRQRYWDQADISSLPQEMQYPAFDTAVNQGVDFAKDAIQKSGNNPQKLIELRREAYNNLAKDPEHAKNLDGWNNRLDGIENMYGSPQKPSEPRLFPSELPPQPQGQTQQPQQMQPMQPQGMPQETQVQQQPQAQPQAFPSMDRALEVLSSRYASEGQRLLANELIKRHMSQLYPDAMTQAKLRGQELQNEGLSKSQDLEQKKYDLQDQLLRAKSAQEAEETKRDIALNDANIKRYNAQAKSYKNQSSGTWSKPTTVIDGSGNQVLVQYNNKTGESKPFEGYSPAPTNKGIEEYQKQTGKSLAAIDTQVNSYEGNQEKINDIQTRLNGKQGEKGLLQKVPYGVLDNIGVGISRTFGADSPAGDAEAEANALLKGITIDSLRASFGGNPTEGERKDLANTIVNLDASPKARLEALQRYIELGKLEYEGNLKTKRQLQGQLGIGSNSQSQSGIKFLGFE